MMKMVRLESSFSYNTISKHINTVAKTFFRLHVAVDQLATVLFFHILATRSSQHKIHGLRLARDRSDSATTTTVIYDELTFEMREEGVIGCSSGCGRLSILPSLYVP